MSIAAMSRGEPDRSAPLNRRTDIRSPGGSSEILVKNANGPADGFLITQPPRSPNTRYYPRAGTHNLEFVVKRSQIGVYRLGGKRPGSGSGKWAERGGRHGT
jgi:hypothetical protein